MIPFRAVLGECRVAVRGPAIVASFLVGLMLLPLVRRLGGGVREAVLAYVVLHFTPLMFLGAFYASTDVAMASAFLAATWAAVALAQGEAKGWWGFGAAVGLGFLAKFPIVTVLPAIIPAVLKGRARRHLATATPYLAAALSFALTMPVWIWAANHNWDNIRFQLARSGGGSLTLKYVAEYAGAVVLLVTPFLAVAFGIAWWVSRRPADRAGWLTARVAAAAPLVLFGLVGLRTRVAPHWGATGVTVFAALLVLTRFRGRKTLAICGAVFGLAVCAVAIVVVLWPEPLLDAEWKYSGRPSRISTSALSSLVGNDEVAARLESMVRPDEFVATQAYSDVHLWAFLTQGRLTTRLAHISGGSHGLASLYWHPPEALRGGNALFATERDDLADRLTALFDEVREDEPLEIVRNGRVVRHFRIYRCRNLLYPEGAFTRLTD
jgi:4-amino-4-deoxy-L-arabinose transferase-like glycosyltransferase